VVSYSHLLVLLTVKTALTYTMYDVVIIRCVIMTFFRLLCCCND